MSAATKIIERIIEPRYHAPVTTAPAAKPKRNVLWIVLGLGGVGVLGCIACGVGLFLIGQPETTPTTPRVVDLATLRREYRDDETHAEASYGLEWIRTTGWAESPTPGAEPFFVMRDTPIPPLGIPVPVIRCIGAPGAVLPPDGAQLSIVGQVGDLREADGLLGMVTALRWLEIRQCTWTSVGS
jgi:hypothetical protein